MKKLLALIGLLLFLISSCAREEVVPTNSSTRSIVYIPVEYAPLNVIAPVLFTSLWRDSYGDYVEFSTLGRVSEYVYYPSSCSYYLSDEDSLVFTNGDTLKYFSSFGTSSYSLYTYTFSSDTLRFSSYGSTSRILVRTQYASISELQNACLARFTPVNIDTLINHIWYNPSYGYYIAIAASGKWTEYSINSSSCTRSIADTDSIVFINKDSLRFYSTIGSSSYSSYRVTYVGDSLVFNYGGYSSSIYLRTAYATIEEATGNCQSSNSSDSYEPDNYHVQAQVASIGTTTPNHSIYPYGDVDYYQVSIPVTGFYTFTTNGSMDTHMTLYDVNGTTILESDDDDGSGSNALIRYDFPVTGNYYIMVRAYSGTSTGIYSLTLSQN